MNEIDFQNLGSLGDKTGPIIELSYHSTPV